jgi:hypothetical protein
LLSQTEDGDGTRRKSFMQEKSQIKSVTWKEFLESFPPDKTVLVSDLAQASTTSAPTLNSGDIQLHCMEPPPCDGTRTFSCISGGGWIYTDGGSHSAYVRYQCRNCCKTTKLFAIVAKIEKNVQPEKGAFAGLAVKLGELPPFGPYTPAKVLRLIQDDRELFLLGRRAENHGMGIGAFAYYRRVVENQKQRLFDKIIEVAKRLSVPSDQIVELQAERDNWQFTSSVGALKAVVPQALLLNGHNPLTLLHRALSAGIHAKTDEECLHVAKSIRVVLIEFAERAAQVLKDHAELDAAVSQLLNPSPQKNQVEKER